MRFLEYVIEDATGTVVALCVSGKELPLGKDERFAANRSVEECAKMASVHGFTISENAPKLQGLNVNAVAS